MSFDKWWQTHVYPHLSHKLEQRGGYVHCTDCDQRLSSVQMTIEGLREVAQNRLERGADPELSNVEAAE